MEKQRNGTAPSSPPSTPPFPGTLPSTPRGTFGDLGFLSPVAGGRDSYASQFEETCGKCGLEATDCSRSQITNHHNVNALQLFLVRVTEDNSGYPYHSLVECTAVAALRLRMRMRILTRPEHSLANFSQTS